MAQPVMSPGQTVAALSSALSDGRTTSEAIVSVCLGQIEQTNERLAAFVAMAGDALAQARAADVRRRAGRSLGPLDGIPVAVKDLFDCEGLPTLGGSRSRSPAPAATSAEAVKRLRNAGMVLVGKTAMVELGCGGWGTQSATSVPWNPWHATVHHVPGGSSSGSAVAVAAGLTPVAIGTDTGGSVRIPAAYCGIVGFKPSPGLIPLDGVIPYSPTHDTIGVLANSVQDASFVFAALAGGLAVSRLDRPLRIGVLDDPSMTTVDADVAAAFDQAVATVKALGQQLVRFEVPESLEMYSRLAGELALAEAFAVHGPAIEKGPDLFGAVVRARIHEGRTARSRSTMLAEREDHGRRFDAAMKDIDVLLGPTCPTGAIPVSAVDESRLPTPFTRPANYLDLPALSIPMGLTAQGMPIGLQLMARRGDDVLLLSFAQMISASLSDGLGRKQA